MENTGINAVLYMKAQILPLCGPGLGSYFCLVFVGCMGS